MRSVACRIPSFPLPHPIAPNPVSETKMATVTKTTVAKANKAKSEAEKAFKRAQRAANLLKQVSDPTRLQVITMLSEGERHAGSLCGALSQSQPAVSHHLALLRHGRIVEPRRQGKNNFYRLTDTGEQLARIVKELVV